MPTHLRLEREQRQAKEHAQSDQPAEDKSVMRSDQRHEAVHSQCLQDDKIVEERKGDAEGERLQDREERKQTEIERVAVALPVQEAQRDQGTKERDVERPDARRRNIQVTSSRH